MNQRTDRFLFWIRLLAVAAVVVSCVLLYEYVRLAAGLSGKSFCNISQTINCDAVSQSKWARILGFPLAGYGLGFYLAVFFLALLSASGRFLERRSAGNVLLLLSIFSVVFSLYLFFNPSASCAPVFMLLISCFFCALWGWKETGGCSCVWPRGAGHCGVLPLCVQEAPGKVEIGFWRVRDWQPC